MDEIQERAKDIELVVLDVDGVLTDGRITYSSTGDEIKSFNVRDGHGLALAKFTGLKIAIISGRYSEVTAIRARELKVDHVYQDIKEKLKKLNELTEELGVNINNVAFIGDDVLDAPPMRKCKLGVAVADAHHSALDAADWITSTKGGHGAVREVLDVIMECRHGKEGV
jgi:3-deoxy-D-manno-octulosonate 8-phosphate phosphatase (KDO 8-P phosphatase)